jgi:putative transcriptional regulator
MADPAAPPLEAGRLLVATPALQDPNFESSVVLLLDVDDNGALGVVLNQASLVRVAEVLPGWADVVSPPDVLFAGGPVSTDSALAVGALPSGGEAEDPVGFRRLYGDIGIIDLDAPPEVVAPALTGLRVFAGYAGWGSAQLEAEVESESWYVVPSLREDMFGADPEGLRRRVLRRQPGELAWVSTRPQDPTLN